MLDRSNDGASEEHSVGTAAEAIAGLLSDETIDELDGAEDSETERDASEKDEVDETPDSETDDDDASEQVDDVEESEEQDETDDDHTPEPRKIKISDDLEVTEEEAAKGYLRTEDYTRKTQELASARKKFEQEVLPVVRAERAELAEKLGQLTKALEAATPQEPDWDTLAEQDPEQFAQLRRAWDKHNERLARAREKEAEARKKVEEDQREAFTAYVSEQREKLFEAIPEWKDSAVAKKDRQDLIEYATAAGFTEAELKQVYDHRVIRLLRDAALYRKAQKAKPDVQKKIERATVVKPGTPKPREGREVVEAKQRAQRLAKTGSVDDAALLIQSMLTPRRSKRRRG